jgi:hypothetical protein
MNIQIDTTTGRHPVSRYTDVSDYGVSFADMAEMERLFGDRRDHGATSYMEFGNVDSPIITAVNVQDMDALRQFVRARGWRIVNA